MSNTKIRPWSAQVGDDKIFQSFVDSYKDSNGNFLELIYDDLEPQEFHFWVDSEKKHITICPFEYFSYNCGHWWEEKIGDFVNRLIGDKIVLHEEEACWFTTDNDLNVVKDVLSQCGLIENKDLKL